MTPVFFLADGPRYAGLFTDFNTTFWSAVLRILEAMVAAAPFLAAGVLAAGVLRGMVGADRVRKILGVGHWSGPLRAWALGVLLPICSLGALPVARELRRAGVPSGTVLSFVLVAPVLNPISIIYGLSNIVPFTLVYFAIGTFVVSVGIGALWNRVISDKRDEVSESLETVPRASIDRLAVVGDTAARSLIGPAAIDYGLALLAVGFLGAFLPHGVLQTGLTRDNPIAPVIMGLVAIPVYVTPVEVMMHFGHIVQDGYSLGAAFALIVLGAGANVGVANWLRRDYGLKPLLLFVGLLIGSTLAIGVTADRTIVHGNATKKDHTHAFDPFTRLATVSDTDANIGWVISEVADGIRRNKTSGNAEVAGIVLLAVIGLAGVALRLLGDRVSVEHLMNQAVADGEGRTDESPGWDPALTPAQLAIAGALCSVAAAVGGLYLYYPPPQDVFEEMSHIRIDAYAAVESEDAVETQRRFAQWRAQLEKLPTSVLLRTGSVSEAQRNAADEVAYAVDSIEKAVVDGRFREANMLIRYTEDLYSECRRAYRSSMK